MKQYYDFHDANQKLYKSTTSALKVANSKGKFELLYTNLLQLLSTCHTLVYRNNKLFTSILL